MSAKSFTLRNDAAFTNVTVAAGTNSNFVEDAVEIPNGIHLHDADESDFRAQTQVTLKSRAPKVVNGIVQKEKRWLTFSRPVTDDDGNNHYEVVRIEIETHPDTAQASKDAFITMACVAPVDSELTDFIQAGSMS